MGEAEHSTSPVVLDIYYYSAYWLVLGNQKKNNGTKKEVIPTKIEIENAIQIRHELPNAGIEIKNKATENKG